MLKMILKGAKSEKGFSLIELMIVVAIIGILAAVAVPNFTAFQRKARQSEGKGILTGIFTAEKAFSAEWNGFTSDFAAAGFSPDGQIRYDSQIGAAAYPVGYTQPAGMTARTTINGNCATKEFPNCTFIGTVAAAAGAMNNAAGFQSFTANASANIGGQSNDLWSMTDKKVLTNTQSGIN